MSSDNPISEMAEGTTKGLLDWSTDKIIQFVQKLKDKKLAFIEEKNTIEVVKEQYHSGEVKFYQKYIHDKNLLFLVRIGLALRKIENDEDRVQNLRNKIYNKYDSNGLHIAQFVQNGILNRYFGLLIEQLLSEEDLAKKMFNILTKINEHSLFVSSNAKVAEIVRKVSTIVDSHQPSIFVIAGTKSAAKIVSDSVSPLETVMEDYELERFSQENKEILFFKKKLS